MNAAPLPILLAAQHAALVRSGRRYHQATARLAQVYGLSTVAVLTALGVAAHSQR